MVVKELAEVLKTTIKIMDARDGRVLCYRYNASKHINLADREILSVWAEIDVHSGGGFHSMARPNICAYVVHGEELPTC
jgi:hypothetical protein